MNRSDGKFWIVPESGPVLIRDDAYHGRWDDSFSETYPIIGIDEVLQRIGPDYELSMLPSVSEADLPTKYLEISARKKLSESNSMQPEQIRVWYDDATHTVFRLEMQWSPARRLQRLTLTFADSKEMPSDWYRRESHHDVGREVIYLNESK